MAKSAKRVAAGKKARRKALKGTSKGGKARARKFKKKK